jgi:hypothetical protein
VYKIEISNDYTHVDSNESEIWCMDGVVGGSHDILAPLSVNEGIDKIDFNPYIHPDVPDKKRLLKLL